MSYAYINNALLTYFKLIESSRPHVHLNNGEKLQSIFDCCYFIEQTICKAKDANKADVCEEVINTWLRTNKKPAIYSYSTLEKVCDNMIWFVVKCREIEIHLVEQFVQIYVHKLGIDRLKNCMDGMMDDAFCTKTVCHALKMMEVLDVQMDRAILVELWERRCQQGQKNHLTAFLKQLMLSDHILWIAPLLVETNCKNLKKLVLKILNDGLNSYDFEMFKQLGKLDVTVISEMIKSDVKFMNALIECTTYICESMRREGNFWITDLGVEYKTVLRILKAFFADKHHGTMHSIKNVIEVRQSIGKNIPIWEQIEIDCAVW